jgi:chromosome partitioning protein
MPVIAIVNSKGGSGKSTLATHLAGHAASIGLPVMLGDVDRQKSTVAWLRRRAREKLPASTPILSWVVDPQRMLRPPQGVTHVVLDTPGGLHGHEMARVVMGADAILVPVCDSAFDRDAATQAWAELQTHPRVASGRCRVAIVGMRIDSRTHAEATLRAWAAKLDAPFLGVLRDTQGYVRCIERGLTIFDLPPNKAQADREQWAPILDWLEPVWKSHDLATPSQAGALDEIAPVEAPAFDEEGTPVKPRIRVTPQRPATRALVGELAEALRPAPRPARGLLQRLFGWGEQLASPPPRPFALTR